MARKLSFEFSGSTFETGIEKVDRKKLYGWVQRQAYDQDGGECYFGTLSGDGTLVLGRESLQQGYLDRFGDWLAPDDLTAVDEYGDAMAKYESSFKAPVSLHDLVTVDEYLRYTAKSVYQLDAPAGLIETVKQQDGLFIFAYNYAASYQPDAGFLIENEGVLFLVVGEPTGFDFVGLTETEPALLIEDEEEEEETDSLDFSMF